MFSILVKDQKNSSMYRFLTVKQEIFTEEIKEVTNPETQEVKNEIVKVPTGETKTVVYSTDNRDDLEQMCIDLLKNSSMTFLYSFQDKDIFSCCNFDLVFLALSIASSMSSVTVSAFISIPEIH